MTPNLQQWMMIAVVVALFVRCISGPATRAISSTSACGTRQGSDRWG